jgi:hypothetical protein
VDLLVFLGRFTQRLTRWPTSTVDPVRTYTTPGDVTACVRARWPHDTPDVGSLVAAPGDYISEHYASLLLWGGSMLAVATLLAASAAAPPAWAIKLLKRLPGQIRPSWIDDVAAPIAYRSAWDVLMNLRVEGDDNKVDVWVSCELQDGTYLSGPLYSLNPDIDEDEDRELGLKAPVSRRSPSEDEPETLDVGAVSVSARYVKYVGWSYVRRESQR